MKFGDILSQTFKDYSQNWKKIFKLMVLFILIPGLLLSIATTYSQFQPENLSLLSLVFILSIIASLFTLFVSVGLVVEAMKNKKGKIVTDKFNGRAKKYFWKYFLYQLLVGIILILVILLLMALPIGLAVSFSSIPLGILAAITSIIALCLVFYLSVKWYFSFYILVEKNTKVIQSLRESSAFVKGRWWKIFGYSLLFGLILIGIIAGITIVTGIIVAIPTGIISFSFAEATTILADGTKLYPFGIQLVVNLLDLLSDFFSSLIFTPLGIFFAKNFYFALKKK